MEKINKEKILKLLASNIKEARLAKSISQEQLAIIANIDRSYVSRLERGIANPTYTTLYQIADALDYPLRNLLPK